jgi:cyclophilin family peptidyl-prolyl cis-trans isomerase
MPANSSKRRALRLEPLEPRLALHAGHDDGPDYPLATAHIHARLSIFIDGQNVAIPANVGAISNNHNPGAQMQIVHTHDTTGTLHIEPFLSPTPVTSYPDVGDFFEIWRTKAASAANNPSATFSSTTLMGLQADATHEVRMYVNGRRSFEFENHLIDEGESIVLVYTEKSAPQSVELVRFTTNVGAFDVELYPEVTPITVENFLSYAGFDDYDGTIIHRSVPNFVIQGGGYLPSGQHIPTDPPIQNEFNIPNHVNTIAMAKLGGNPHSATSEWYVNLRDNSSNLDNQNGGFTVFGRVLTPDAEPQQVSAVIAAIAALPIVNNTVHPAWTHQPVVNEATRDPVIVQSIRVVHGEIHGLVFLDADQDGQQDSGEMGQPGWTVFVDENNNGSRDASEPSAATGADGYYTLTDVAPGDQVVRIQALAGYSVVQPSTSAHSVTVHGAAIVEDQNFGVVAASSGQSEIRGRLFYDIHGNGRQDAVDSPLSGWDVYLDADGNGSMGGAEKRAATSADGSFILAGLDAGTHIVRLSMPPGYSVTLPISALRTVTLADDQTIGRQNFAVQSVTQSCINADFDHSGAVTRADFALLVQSFRSPGGPPDLDVDGDVDLRDLVRFNSVFGQQCSSGSPGAAVATTDVSISPRSREPVRSIAVGRPTGRPIAGAIDHLAKHSLLPSPTTLRVSRLTVAGRRRIDESS